MMPSQPYLLSYPANPAESCWPRRRERDTRHATDYF